MTKDKDAAEQPPEAAKPAFGAADAATESAPQSDAPEVEAEIVDDAAPALNEAPAGVDDQDATDAGSPQPSRSLTPGVVLFLVFVGVSALVFLLWRLQSGVAATSASEPDAAIRIASAQVAQEQVAETDPAQVDTPQSDQRDAPPDSGSPAATEPLEAVDASSMGEDDMNQADASEQSADRDNTPDLSPAVSEQRQSGDERSDVAEEDTAAGFGDAAATPPVLEADAASAAEAAADLFAADPEIPMETAQAATNQSLEETGGGLAVDVSADADQAVAALSNDGGAAPDEALREEAEALRNALAQERNRTQAQQSEIAAMRREFSETMRQRDAESRATIEDLRSRLRSAQSNSGSAQNQSAAAGLAIAALRSAADQGLPFEDELDALAKLAPEATAIDRLRPFASSGAPTLASLKARFSADAVRTLAAAGRENADGVLGRFAARFKSLVSMRPAGPIAGETPRAVISRAEHALENDDVIEAVSELRSLTGEARSVMDAWIEQAEARARVEAALGDINAALSRRLQQQ